MAVAPLSPKDSGNPYPDFLQDREIFVFTLFPDHCNCSCYIITKSEEPLRKHTFMEYNPFILPYKDHIHNMIFNIMMNIIEPSAL